MSRRHIEPRVLATRVLEAPDLSENVTVASDDFRALCRDYLTLYQQAEERTQQLDMTMEALARIEQLNEADAYVDAAIAIARQTLNAVETT